MAITPGSPRRPPIPARLGRYEIVERLNAGGMGEVFVARVAGPGGFLKAVALKRIHPHLASDQTFIDMLHDEANVAAALRHPNIVAMIDVGQEAGEHFVVLEYVSGDALSRIVREMKARKDVVPPWVVAWVGAQIASALHAAHEAKALSGESLEIVHRDVSLANIMLSDSGHGMLFDFGVAKAKQRLSETRHGELKGKLAYMAPETFRGAPVTRAVDVFGLGVVLYELLTNVSPFQRDTDVDTIAALSTDVPAPSQVKNHIDPRLDAIVFGAIARDRSKRYPTAEHIERALREWAHATQAPHDAGAVASWYAATFPDRLAARKALLTRVADPSIDAARAVEAQQAVGSDQVTHALGTQLIPTPTSSPFGTPGFDPRLATPSSGTVRLEPQSATMRGFSSAHSMMPKRSHRGIQIGAILAAFAVGLVVVSFFLSRSDGTAPAPATSNVAASAIVPPPPPVTATAAPDDSSAPATTASADATPSATSSAASSAKAPQKPKMPHTPPPQPDKKAGKGPLVRSYE